LCAASRVASAAARALRRLESVEDEARVYIAETAEPSAMNEKEQSSRVEVGLPRRSSSLERVAVAARAFASRVAAAAASSSLLEGAAAQPWGFHRKPEAMSGAQPCSPHIVVWRACALRGMRGLEAACGEETEGDAAFADAGETLAAYVDHVAAESAGAYARVVPSRAWRDRYVWDARTIAETLRAMDQRRTERYHVDASFAAEGKRRNTARCRTRSVFARASRGAPLLPGVGDARVARVARVGIDGDREFRNSRRPYTSRSALRRRVPRRRARLGTGRPLRAALARRGGCALFELAVDAAARASC
jgi:hypothetical protein